MPALDGVRGVAILLVLLHHVGVAKHGWVGVDLFFVLSGYLITGILLRTKSRLHYYRNFFARRALRIIPACYVFLMFTLVAYPLILRHPLPPHQWPVWAYLTNVPIAFGGWTSVPSGVEHLWSVAVEEQFYLVWPIVVAITSVSTLRRLCIVGIVAALGFRIAIHLLPDAGLASYVLMPARMDTLLLGSWLAVAPAGSWCNRKFTVLLIGGAASVSAALILINRDAHAPLVETLGYSAIAVAAAAIVAGANFRTWWSRALSCRPLRSAGKYSYAAYLGHVRVIEELERFTVLRGWSLAAASTVLTFLFAAVSWRILEAPLLSLKRYFDDGPVPPVHSDSIDRLRLWTLRRDSHPRSGSG